MVREVCVKGWRGRSDSRSERREEMAYRVSVVIERDDHGYFAFSPEIEGCQAQGTSFEGVVQQVSVMITQYMEPARGNAPVRLPA